MEFEIRCGQCRGKEARLRGKTIDDDRHRFVQLTLTCVRCGSVNILKLETPALRFTPVGDSPGTFCGPWSDEEKT